MAGHSSVLAWRIPWTEEPGGLQSMGSQRVTQLKQCSTHSLSQHITPSENMEKLYTVSKKKTGS